MAEVVMTLNLAFSVKGRGRNTKLMSSLMIEFGRDGEGRGIVIFLARSQDLQMM